MRVPLAARNRIVRHGAPESPFTGAAQIPGASQRREPRPAKAAAWGILTSPRNSRRARGWGNGGDDPSSIRAKTRCRASLDIREGAEVSMPRPSRSSICNTCPRQASQVSRWADTVIAGGAGRSPVA